MSRSLPLHRHVAKVPQGRLTIAQRFIAAEILKQEGASYFIHYKGYGTNWDEWVTLERLGVYSGVE